MLGRGFAAPLGSSADSLDQAPTLPFVQSCTSTDKGAIRVRSPYDMAIHVQPLLLEPGYFGLLSPNSAATDNSPCSAVLMQGLVWEASSSLGQTADSINCQHAPEKHQLTVLGPHEPHSDMLHINAQVPEQRVSAASASSSHTTLSYSDFSAAASLTHTDIPALPMDTLEHELHADNCTHMSSDASPHGQMPAPHGGASQRQHIQAAKRPASSAESHTLPPLPSVQAAQFPMAHAGMQAPGTPAQARLGRSRGRHSTGSGHSDSELRPVSDGHAIGSDAALINGFHAVKPHQRQRTESALQAHPTHGNKGGAITARHSSSSTDYEDDFEAAETSGDIATSDDGHGLQLHASTGSDASKPALPAFLPGQHSRAAPMASGSSPHMHTQASKSVPPEHGAFGDAAVQAEPTAHAAPSSATTPASSGWAGSLPKGPVRAGPPAVVAPPCKAPTQQHAGVIAGVQSLPSNGLSGSRSGFFAALEAELADIEKRWIHPSHDLAGDGFASHDGSDELAGRRRSNSAPASPRLDFGGLAGGVSGMMEGGGMMVGASPGGMHRQKRRAATLAAALRASRDNALLPLPEMQLEAMHSTGGGNVIITGSSSGISSCSLQGALDGLSTAAHVQHVVGAHLDADIDNSRQVEAHPVLGAHLQTRRSSMPSLSAGMGGGQQAMGLPQLQAPDANPSQAAASAPVYDGLWSQLPMHSEWRVQPLQLNQLPSVQAGQRPNTAPAVHGITTSSNGSNLDVEHSGPGAAASPAQALLGAMVDRQQDTPQHISKQHLPQQQQQQQLAVPGAAGGMSLAAWLEQLGIASGPEAGCAHQAAATENQAGPTCSAQLSPRSVGATRSSTTATGAAAAVAAILSPRTTDFSDGGEGSESGGSDGVSVQIATEHSTLVQEADESTQPTAAAYGISSKGHQSVGQEHVLLASAAGSSMHAPPAPPPPTPVKEQMPDVGPQQAGAPSRVTAAGAEASGVTDGASVTHGFVQDPLQPGQGPVSSSLLTCILALMAEQSNDDLPPAACLSLQNADSSEHAGPVQSIRSPLGTIHPLDHTHMQTEMEMQGIDTLSVPAAINPACAEGGGTTSAGASAAVCSATASAPAHSSRHGGGMQREFSFRQQHFEQQLQGAAVAEEECQEAQPAAAAASLSLGQAWGPVAEEAAVSSQGQEFWQEVQQEQQPVRAGPAQPDQANMHSLHPSQAALPDHREQLYGSDPHDVACLPLVAGQQAAVWSGRIADPAADAWQQALAAEESALHAHAALLSMAAADGTAQRKAQRPIDHHGHSPGSAATAASWEVQGRRVADGKAAQLHAPSGQGEVPATRSTGHCSSMHSASIASPYAGSYLIGGGLSFFHNAQLLDTSSAIPSSQQADASRARRHQQRQRSSVPSPSHQDAPPPAHETAAVDNDVTHSSRHHAAVGDAFLPAGTWVAASSLTRPASCMQPLPTFTSSPGRMPAWRHIDAATWRGPDAYARLPVTPPLHNTHSTVYGAGAKAGQGNLSTLHAHLWPEHVSSYKSVGPNPTHGYGHSNGLYDTTSYTAEPTPAAAGLNQPGHGHQHVHVPAWSAARAAAAAAQAREVLAVAGQVQVLLQASVLVQGAAAGPATARSTSPGASRARMHAWERMERVLAQRLPPPSSSPPSPPHTAAAATSTFARSLQSAFPSWPGHASPPANMHPSRPTSTDAVSVASLPAVSMTADAVSCSSAAAAAGGGGAGLGPQGSPLRTPSRGRGSRYAASGIHAGSPSSSTMWKASAEAASPHMNSSSRNSHQQPAMHSQHHSAPAINAATPAAAARPASPLSAYVHAATKSPLRQPLGGRHSLRSDPWVRSTKPLSPGPGRSCVPACMASPAAAVQSAGVASGACIGSGAPLLASVLSAVHREVAPNATLAYALDLQWSQLRSASRGRSPPG